MGSPDLFRALTRTLRDEEAHAVSADDIQLTPYLSIVVAILYMMAVDGDISDRESSQLQAVIGADGAILRRAVAYAQAHDVDHFLQDAPPLLDADASLCLLVNVADSLMADGELQKLELALFERMLSAFGQTKAGFQTHFDAIAVKGRTSVLGDFAAAAASDEMSPPKALVVAMLYMISVDGEMAAEEIGRLSAAIGGSQALLKPSLRFVNQVRAPQFLAQASGLLDKRQRLCILLNVCDAMMSDREVDAAERELFGRMIAAFGIAPASLDAYMNTLRVKNDVPHDDIRSVKRRPPPVSLTRGGKRKSEEGVVFVRKRTWAEQTGEGGKAGSAEHQAVDAGLSAPASEAPLDSRISRMMLDNIDRLANEFDDELTLARLEQQSRDDGSTGAPQRGTQGPSDLRIATDSEGATDLRRASDANSGTGRKALRDARMSDDSKHWKDAAVPGAHRHMRDVEPLGSATHLVDDRSAFDSDTVDDADAPELQGEIHGRMGAVRDRTKRIRDHIEAMLVSRSLRAGSRLPVLPPLPSALPTALPAASIGKSDAGTPLPTSELTIESDDGSGMLLASDEGGPRMSEATAPAAPQQARMNRLLRLRSAVLLPALFVTYGATMVGETLSERLFIANENMATDARIVHQMASVQQSVYRIAPEAVQLAPDMLPAGALATAAVASDEAPSDRQKAESFLEQRKQVLQENFRQHQSSSAVAAERQQWFVFAKSIVLLGLGMTFWGMLFRSLRMLHGSTAAGIAALLLTANGYWLFLRF